MELAVVSIDGRRVPPRREMEGVTDRLAARRCAEAVSIESNSREAHLVADRLGIKACTVPVIDLDSLIRNRAGTNVAVLCDAGSARELVADVLDVPESALPLPRQLSLTIVRASRSGARSVLCLNDTMHLTNGDRTPATVEGM